jgi:DNA-directed RNA polymerase specialized sigma24 family protein
VYGSHTLGVKRPAELKGAGVAEEEARRMVEALDEVEAIEDPVRRSRAISEVLAEVRKRSPRLTKERNATVLELRAQGKSIRKIAAEVGVSAGTVQDILRGHGGSWGNRPSPTGQESGPQPEG